MSNAHSTNEGHIGEDGRKRRTKKDDRNQLPIFGDWNPPTPPSGSREESIPPHMVWRKVSIRMERMKDRTVIRILAQTMDGKFREMEIFTDYRQTMPLLIVVEGLISKHWL